MKRRLFCLLPLLLLPFVSACDWSALGDKLFGGGKNTEYDFAIYTFKPIENGVAKINKNVDWINLHWVTGNITVKAYDPEPEDIESDEEDVAETILIKEKTNKEIEDKLKLHYTVEKIDNQDRLYIEYCKSGTYDWTGIEKDVEVYFPRYLIDYLCISTYDGNVTIEDMSVNRFSYAPTSAPDADISFKQCNDELSIATLDNEKDFKGHINVTCESDTKNVSLSGQGFNVKLGNIEKCHMTLGSNVNFEAKEVKDMDVKNEDHNNVFKFEKMSNFSLTTGKGDTTIYLPEDYRSFNATLKKGTSNFETDFDIDEKTDKEVIRGTKYVSKFNIYSEGTVKILKYKK